MNFFIEGVQITNEKIKIKGWMQKEFAAVIFTLSVNGEIYKVDTVLSERKDVYDFYNGEIELNSGFEFCCSLKADTIKENNEVILEEEGKVLIHDYISVERGIKYYLDDILLKKAEGKLEIRGWAFSLTSKESVNVKIEVDNKIVQEFEANRLRSDVKKIFLNIEQAENCGFTKFIKVGENAPKEIYAIFTDKTGYKVKHAISLPIEVSTENSKISGIVEQVKKVYKKLHDERQLKNLKKYIKEALEEYNNEYKQIDINEILKQKKRSEVWRENNRYSQDLKKFINGNLLKNPPLAVVLFILTDNSDQVIESIIKQQYQDWILYVIPLNGQVIDYNKKNNKINVISKENYEDFFLDLSKTYKNTDVILMDDTVILNDMAMSAFVSVKNDNSDLYYSDSYWEEEDYLMFKPDWSPHLLLSYNYIGNFIVVKGDKIRYSDFSFSSSFSLIYTFIINFTERNLNIFHIPQVLYSVSNIGYDIKKEQNKNILKNKLLRKGINADVIFNKISETYLEPLFELEFQDDGPSVEIIIPTKNQLKLLMRCIKSLEKTSYKNYKITIIDNESDEEEVLQYFNSIESEKIQVKLVKNKEKNVFSYSYINNKVAEESTADFLLFLNNDTEILTPKWLSNMMGYGGMDNVGVIGAKLIFPDRTLQHAGLIIGANDSMAAPAFKLYPEEEEGYMLFPHTTRNYSAVTAACMLVSKDLFLRTGKFDEENFAVAYNDIDFCLRVLTEQKKEIVYVSNALIMHYEGASRGYIDKIDELLSFKEKYKRYIDGYYNRNLSLKDANFIINVDNSFSYNIIDELPVKLVALTHNLQFEGAPLQLVEIMSGLNKKNKFQIEIWSPVDGPLHEIIENEYGLNVKVVPFEKVKFEDPKEYLHALNNFKTCLMKEGVSILVANTLESFYAIDAAADVHIPNIWIIHESCEYNSYFKYLKQVVQERYLKCFSKTNKMLFVSHATEKLFEDADVKNSSYTIHNGLPSQDIIQFKKEISKEEARNALNILGYEKVILCVGITCERKQQLDLVKAVNHLKDKNILVCIVGGREGRYLDHIIDCIGENHLESSVRIVMESKDVNYYYRASDIFVCTSGNESYPRVILEAMAFELPIITTPVFGIKEQVFESVNGYFFNPGDYKKLSDLIRMLIEEEKTYSGMKDNTLKVLNYISNYDDMIQAYEKILSQMKYINFRLTEGEE